MTRLLKRAFLAILAGCLLLQPLAGAAAAAAADEAPCESPQHQCLCGETCPSPALTAERCTSFLPAPGQPTSAHSAFFAGHSTRPGLPPPLPSRG